MTFAVSFLVGTARSMREALLMTPRRRNRRVAFTARSIGHMAPETQPVDWFDASTPGLALRVTSGGARTWYAFYRKGQTSRRVKLGAWPALDLSKARTLARQTRVRVETEGADPAHERHAARAVFTVGDLARLYIETHAKPHKRSWREDDWKLSKYILPAWASRPVAAITRTDVHALLDTIAGDGKPVQANRVKALISMMWNVAVDRGHADTNPCYRMAKPASERARSTVLSDNDLRALWTALDAQPGDPADAIRLRLLTGQRGGDVHRMRWADVDVPAGVWTIPVELAKNGRAHRVSLTTPALAILERRHAARMSGEPRVFPGLSHQRQDLRAFGRDIQQGAYRWHDLRRTVATRLAALGIPEGTISRVLGHAQRGVTAIVYNQHQYDAEKRRALDRWARALRDLVAPPERGAEIVPLRRPGS